MIFKLEIEEAINIFDIEILTVDAKNNNIIKIKNDTIINRKEINIDINNFNNLIKIYTLYWNKEYINNKIIDGNETDIRMYTDKEKISYKFKNKYPDNYNEFITALNEMVNI